MIGIYFKKLDSVLYITMDGMTQAGFNKKSLVSSCGQNIKTLPFIKNPNNLKQTLFDFENLGQKYKHSIIAQFGDPYEYIAKEPIKKLVVKDLEADSFFTTHRYNENKSLPPETIDAYTTAASWLNMLIKYNDDKKFIKKELGISLTSFWDSVKEIIAADKIQLPGTYKWLRAKMKEYEGKNYACLIDWRYGNSNGVKVKDELAESTLLEMIANPQQHDDVWIMLNYNAWAKANGRKTITDATVGNYRRRNYDLLIMQREGREAYYNEFSKSIKGYRPTQPLFLLESDDNHLDFFFTDWEDNSSHRHFNKFKAIVVTDSYNDYVLGYAFAQELTVDVVRQAYANAIHHIKQITGSYYLPHETKTDRWGIKKLEPFYKSLGNYFKTPVGSKRRGYIEQFFGGTLWERCAKYGTNNYTGHNITAKNDGVNKEVLNANRKDYPTIQEAPQFIHDFFYRLRHMPNSKGISKQQQWLTAFNAMPVEELKPIGDEEFLLKLGTLRLKRGTNINETNKITDRGLDISIAGRKYNFEIPDQYYFQHKGCEVATLYDPNDMSRILVTDFNRCRFIATAPVLQPRALRDYEKGDRTRLNTLLTGKHNHVEHIAGMQLKRQQILENNGVNINSLLASGFVLKEDRHAAELEYARQEMQHLPEPPRRNINPLDKM